jgi:hypothetical protein
MKSKTDGFTFNHSVRAAALSLVIAKKFPPLAQNKDLDVEAIVLSNLLHDMGWTMDKSLLKKDLRFEVDGANIARDFINHNHASHGESHFDKHRIQLIWDAIALHATPTIAAHKEPEVLATHLGILADFFGPNLPLAPPGTLVTPEEFREVLQAYPRLDFKNEIRQLFCGMCQEKDITVVAANFVKEYGLEYGYDAKGTGKEEFSKKIEEAGLMKGLEKALDETEQYE